MEGKKLLKTLAISTGFVILLLFAVEIFNMSDWLSLRFNIGFVP